VVRPEAIAPSEWLPAVWGGAGATSFGGARREAEVRAVIAHYERVARSLSRTSSTQTSSLTLGLNSSPFGVRPWGRTGGL